MGRTSTVLCGWSLTQCWRPRAGKRRSPRECRSSPDRSVGATCSSAYIQFITHIHTDRQIFLSSLCLYDFSALYFIPCHHNIMMTWKKCLSLCMYIIHTERQTYFPACVCMMTLWFTVYTMVHTAAIYCTIILLSALLRRY